jgi:hypothetical protein
MNDLSADMYSVAASESHLRSTRVEFAQQHITLAACCLGPEAILMSNEVQLLEYCDELPWVVEADEEEEAACLES